jgi:lysyl-tRNA synthetase class II
MLADIRDNENQNYLLEQIYAVTNLSVMTNISEDVLSSFAQEKLKNMTMTYSELKVNPSFEKIKNRNRVLNSVPVEDRSENLFGKVKKIKVKKSQK